MDVAIVSSANGGVGSFTFNLAIELGELADSVDLYLYRDSSRNVPKGDLPENVNVVIESPLRSKFVVDLLRFSPKMSKYDVVHNVVLSPHILLLRSLGIKTVNTVHPQPVLSTDDLNLSSKINEVAQKIEKWTQPFISRVADETVTVSEDSANLVRQKWGVDPEVVYHGVDDEKFAPDVEGADRVRENLGLGPEETLFLYVGILYPKKDIGTLIDAIPEIINESGDCKFLIIGRGPEEELLHKKIERQNLDDYVIHKQYVEDINEYYAASDIFVLPSFIEEFGIVYVEAMQSGLPVVAADIDVAEEVVGDAGVYFTPKDSSDLAKSVLDLLGNDDQIKTLSENGINRAKIFSWERAAQDYYEIYSEIQD